MLGITQEIDNIKFKLTELKKIKKYYKRVKKHTLCQHSELKKTIRNIS